MNTEQYMEKIEELLETAWTLPLSNGKCVVDAQTINEFINEMRLSMPPELSQAKAIVMDRNDIVANAKKEAEMIISAAKEKARALVSNEEVYQQAKNAANEIVRQAKEEAAEISRDAKEQANSMVNSANSKANEIVTSSTTKANEITTNATEYVETTLAKTLQVLTDSANEVKQTQIYFKSNKPQLK